MRRLIPRLIFFVSGAIVGSGCNFRRPADNAANSEIPLSDARNVYKTILFSTPDEKSDNHTEVDTPPADFGKIVYFPTKVGKMVAYLSNIPDDGKLHPAMIWITGGFGNDIGDVWSLQNEDNDQSASAIREAGIVMMYPSQRHGNGNPGEDESCYGEIDDIISAAVFLARQKGIDSGRIYLGGHSTGGTKVLLVAECSVTFRAFFSLGPVADIRGYGQENLTYDINTKKESILRSPIEWFHSIKRPVYVFEGEDEAASNVIDLRLMKKRATTENNKLLHFFEVKGKNHFSAIRPVCKAIASEVLRDSLIGDVDMEFKKEF